MPKVETPPTVAVTEATFAALAEKRLRVSVGTDFSGTDAPVYALRKLGIQVDHVFSSDVMPAAMNFIQLNESPANLYRGVENRVGVYVDIYVSGFPCQCFSIMNKQQRDTDQRRDLYMHSVNYVIAFRPQIFIFENVTRLVSSKPGSVWEKIEPQLNALSDYDWGIRILNPKHFDCPQSRNRVFIVGVRKDATLAKLCYPEPVPLTKTVLDILDWERDASRNLGQHKLAASYRSMLSKWNLGEERAILEFNAMSLLLRPYKMSSPTEETTTRARAQLRSEVAPCMISHEPGHYALHLGRLLNVNEQLRLQGFDDRDIDVGDISARQVQRLLGNCMNVSVLKHLFAALLV